MADFTIEKKLWDSGIEVIAGIDEVGRGSLAGPLVAACVGFNSDIAVPDDVILDDSKKLTHKKRLVASNWIKGNSLICGIGIVDVIEIDKYGIAASTQMAFKRSIENAVLPFAGINRRISIDHYLTDAYYISDFQKYPRSVQTPVVKGDEKSASIAAASIVAKIFRDSLMCKLAGDLQFQMYRWDSNKGYGTGYHVNAISQHGVSIHHRKQFVRKINLS